MRIETLDLTEYAVVPVEGRSARAGEKTTSISATRFAGVTFTESTFGVIVKRGSAATLIPWGLVRQAHYAVEAEAPAKPTKAA